MLSRSKYTACIYSRCAALATGGRYVPTGPAARYYHGACDICGKSRLVDYLHATASLALLVFSRFLLLADRTTWDFVRPLRMGLTESMNDICQLLACLQALPEMDPRDLLPLASALAETNDQMFLLIAVQTSDPGPRSSLASGPKQSS